MSNSFLDMRRRIRSLLSTIKKADNATASKLLSSSSGNPGSASTTFPRVVSGASTGLTFTLVPHPANEIKDVVPATPETLLTHSAWETCSTDYSAMLSSSFGQGNQNQILVGDYVGTQNGLVDAVLAAHNQHHALSLRPDDIWLAIATQFSFFVNKHAEQLRGRFVAHTGQKALYLEICPPQLFDGAFLAPAFAKELSKHVTDVGLRQWIVPNFSTTTETDRIVGCAVLMGAMKKYFTYAGGCCCGIPRITIEGTREDWEEILRRVDRIAEYGDECVLWHRMLIPILRRFVGTFDDPQLKNEDTLQFWKNMVQYRNPGSGQPYISGWLTAFCMFDSDGNWQGRRTSAAMMDGVGYATIDVDDIPPGYVTVDIKLDNDGDVHNAMMLAGVVTQRVFSSGDTSLSPSGQNDGLAPGVAWFLFDKK